MEYLIYIYATLTAESLTVVLLGGKIHFKNYIIWHLYIVFLHQPINFLHLPIVWLLTSCKGGTPLVPCFAHAILDHISAC